MLSVRIKGNKGGSYNSHITIDYQHVSISESRSRNNFIAFFIEIISAACFSGIKPNQIAKKLHTIAICIIYTYYQRKHVKYVQKHDSKKFSAAQIKGGQTVLVSWRVFDIFQAMFWLLKLTPTIATKIRQSKNLFRK